MTHYPKQIIRLGVLTAWFVGAFITHAQDGALRDTAAFFSEPAKAEASRTIAEIGRRFRKDLVIETFREIPAAVRQGVNLQDKPAVNGLFTQWTQQQARQRRKKLSSCCCKLLDAGSGGSDSMWEKERKKAKAFQ